MRKSIHLHSQNLKSFEFSDLFAYQSQVTIKESPTTILLYDLFREFIPKLMEVTF